jgi:hypothetical protein
MMANIYTAFATESTGHSVPRLRIFLEFISQRLAATDFERAIDLLHAVVSPAAARKTELVGRLAEALRRKYATPADCMLALGLDPKLLLESSMNNRHRSAYDGVPGEKLLRDRRARDQESESAPWTAESLESYVVWCLENMMGEGEADRFCGKHQTFGEQGASDEPPEFSGRPRPGGEIDPVRQASDARLALDFSSTLPTRSADHG